MPASEVYSDAGIIAITPGSTNPQITERGMSDMFRMCGRDDQQGQVASDFIIDKLKAKRVVIIHDKDTYGQGLADATKAALAKRGVQDVMYEGLSRGEKTLTPGHQNWGAKTGRRLLRGLSPRSRPAGSPDA